MKNKFGSPFRLRPFLAMTASVIVVSHIPDRLLMATSFPLEGSRFATAATAKARSSSTDPLAPATTTERARTKAAATITRLRSSSDGNHNENSDGDQEGEKKSDDDRNDAIDDLLSRKDEFLDRPFFDPSRYEEDDESLPGRFANWTKSDYPLAEAAFSTVYFLVLVVVAKELLRMQLYGSEYVPFTQGVAPGKLF